MTAFFSALPGLASGPLDGVDHWRGTFPGFRPGFDIFRGASGPLDGVDHWRGTFPSFWPGSGIFPGSQWSTRRSGPLARDSSQILAWFRRLLRGFLGYGGDLFDRICWLVNLAPLFIYYIDK